MTRNAIVLSVMAFLFVLGSKAEAANQEVKIGTRIDNLKFKDTHYLARSLDDFKKKKGFVLVFTTTSCPLVQRYWPTLKTLEKEYRDKDVQFLAVNVGPDDSIVSMATQAILHEVEFPFVKDLEGALPKALGVQRTPEVVLLDEGRVLRYRGRIDDQYRPGVTKEAASRHDLKEAIEAVLAGREVSVKETTVDGCLITHPTIREPKETITFAKHVAPILAKHCQECHKPETTAPFSLITYAQAAGKANMIAEVVAEQRMPPWFASADHGKIVNRRGLSAAERETILDWVRTGKARGDDSTVSGPLPKDPEAGKWEMGKPDLVITMKETHDLPASGDIAYKYTLLPYTFPHDAWVQELEILPDNPRVVHHCNLAFAKPGQTFREGNFITGKVPGNPPMRLTDNVAFFLPKGSILGMQIHYVTTGKKEKCQISVGLRFAREKVQKQLKLLYLANTKFSIPPGASAHPVSSSKVLENDADGLAFFTHMHLRGKDMVYKAYYPDGKSETLLIIANYDFNWQVPYRLEPGKKRFPKGTRIEAVAHYDNSAFNPFNPNPKATVRDGPQTYHEMMNGFFFYMDAGERLNLDVDPKTGKAR